MLCCICLLESSAMSYIFNKSGQDLKIAEIIGRHLWFKPQPDDELNSYICNVCWETVNSFNEFYQQVEKIHAEFWKESSDKTEQDLVTTSPIKKENEQFLVSDNVVQLKIENEYGTRQKNVEKVDYLEKADDQLNDIDNIDRLLHCSLDELDISYEDSNMKTENQNDTDASFEPSETSEPEPDSRQLNRNSKNTNKKKRKHNSQQANQSTKESESVKKRKVYNRFDPVQTDAIIQKHIPMLCSLCAFVGNTFQDIIVHFSKFHSKIRPYITCCGKKLTMRFHISQHALQHENPNCFRCEECNKSFTSTRGLRRHNLSYHASEEELTFVCDLCPKKFARQSFLELHKTSHIPREQWSFFCTKCQPRKTFASQYLLNIHTIMQHKRSTNVCHVCAKEIRSKPSFEKHVRSHFEESGPRVPCPHPGCESWLKDEENLRIHLKRHYAENVIYKCPQCNKEFNGRRKLTNHQKYSHSNETFQCEQCDKTFKKALSLREHMAQHTGETLYKCLFCDRTFNSNANMHAHKKHQHPIEWEEWRRTKTGSSQVMLKNMD